MFLGLRKETWLNDEVINFYMQMLIEREQAISSPQSLYLLSFFFSKLTGDDADTITYNYANVERWTKKKNIFSMRYIFSAINYKKSHWKVIYLILAFKVIVIYDPLGHTKSDVKRYGEPALQVSIRTIFI